MMHWPEKMVEDLDYRRGRSLLRTTGETRERRYIECSCGEQFPNKSAWWVHIIEEVAP